MNNKKFLFSILFLFILSTPTWGQSIPDLPPPVYVPNYVELDRTTMDEVADAINRQNKAARMYAREIFDVIYKYLPYSVDRKMENDLQEQKRRLTKLLEKGSPRSHEDEMTAIQNEVREIISNGIIRQRQLNEEKQREREFINSINSLKKAVNKVDFRNKTLETINDFKYLDINQNRIKLETGKTGSFSAIQYPAGINSNNNFLLESFIQVLDFKPYKWDPSVGLIFGSDSKSNYFVFKINFIDKSIDVIRHNFGENSKELNKHPIQNLNKSSAGNKLSIYKRGAEIYFFINGEKVYQTNGLYMYGEFVGIYAEEGLNLSIPEFSMFKK